MPRKTASERNEPPSKEDRQRILEVLSSNQGFAEPENWIEYARQNNFTRVRAEKLLRCPECGGDRSVTLGQYVYFSTLSKLQKCRNCGLAYSDSRIDAEEVRTHFEGSYKEENYFRVWRQRIVEQIARLVDRYSPHGGRVLDIGGATGYQMAVVQRMRPDLDITISDLSGDSCAAAASSYGFKTIRGRMTELAELKAHFDVVVMSDVIYYEQDLAGTWRMLPEVVAEGGSVIIRAPNTLTLITLAHYVSRLFGSRKSSKMSDRIPFFTPDHFFVFSRRFLTTRLRALGLHPVITLPSELLTPDWKSRYLHPFWFRLAKAISALTFGRLVLTPSILYVATRPPVGEEPAVSAEQSE